MENVNELSATLVERIEKYDDSFKQVGHASHAMKDKSKCNNKKPHLI